MTTVSRRTLLQSAALAFGLHETIAAQEHSLDRIGVQLYTVRSIITKDPRRVLKSIEEIGYREAEVIWATLNQIWPDLQQTKIKPVSVHLDSALFHPENRSQLVAAIEGCAHKGVDFAVYPYLPPAERGGADSFKSLAETLNRAGAECRKAGMKLCYHNHAFEFQPLATGTGFDILLAESDKSLVGLELDVFWVSVAGHNPVDLLKKYKGRIPLLHVKNKAEGTPVQFNESVPKSAFKEAGAGSIDMPAVLRAAAEAGVKHYFVEQDQTPGDPLDSLRTSYQYLQSLKF